MKMHERLSAGCAEPRNQVQCKLRVSYNEESGEPVQLWLTNTLKKQGIFLTRDEAYELRNSLTRTLDNT